MRIRNISLKNIGPFREGVADFQIPLCDNSKNNNSSANLVTIITGENGTGKTIILDAIRGILLGEFGNIERNIVQNENDYFVKAEFYFPKRENNHFEFTIKELVQSTKLTNKKRFHTNNYKLNGKFNHFAKQGDIWLVNYWTSKLASDTFELKNLIAPQPEKYLIDSLNGIQPNIEVTQLICFFDYLKSSDNQKEKELGEYLFELLKKIIKLSLLEGEFKYVERRTLTPIIYQTGQEVSLDKLSSGNLYLIQRLVSLLGQMYSVHVLNNTPLDDLCNTPGLLLIDEAENHLHPKWQKTFLNSILEIFPNMQIIVTTHSPFIVSSVENANVYVCKSMNDYSVIENKTAEYSNKPIEEILLSPVFNTHGFNAEISNLIRLRKQAIFNNDIKKANEIAQKLKEINPEYFSYFDVENLLQQISK